MAAKKKTTRRNNTKPLHQALDRIEKELPSNLGKYVHQVRKGLDDLEKQIEKTRKEGEDRWERQQNQVRRDIAAMLRRLEKAVAPPKKRAPRKKAATRTAAATPAS